MSSPLFRFPPREQLLACLRAHPMLQDRWDIKNRTHEYVAEQFANQEKTPGGLKLGVKLTIKDMNEDLKLDLKGPFPEFNIVWEQALKDCSFNK